MKRITLILVALISTLIIVPSYADDDWHQDEMNKNYHQSKPSVPWKGCYKGHRKPQEVIDYKNIAISKKTSLSKVTEAISKAAIDNSWIVSQVEQKRNDASMVATLVVRNKHTIKVDIKYSDTSYSITYNSSDAMNAALCEGKVYIHPNYNVWVKKLMDQIHKELNS